MTLYILILLKDTYGEQIFFVLFCFEIKDFDTVCKHVSLLELTMHLLVHLQASTYSAYSSLALLIHTVGAWLNTYTHIYIAAVIFSF